MKATPTSNHINTRLTRDSMPQGPRRRMADEHDLCFNISSDPNGRAVCTSSSWMASASDDCGCRAPSTTNGSGGLAIPRSAAGGNERSGAWLDVARSNVAGMRRSGAPSRAQTTIHECSRWDPSAAPEDAVVQRSSPR
jgi:hypothetical protein